MGKYIKKHVMVNFTKFHWILSYLYSLKCFIFPFVIKKRFEVTTYQSWRWTVQSSWNKHWSFSVSYHSNSFIQIQNWKWLVCKKNNITRHFSRNTGKRMLAEGNKLKINWLKRGGGCPCTICMYSKLTISPVEKGKFEQIGNWQGAASWPYTRHSQMFELEEKKSKLMSSRWKDLNPGPPHHKASTLTFWPHCLSNILRTYITSHPLHNSKAFGQTS